jgi:hypothetical protein
MPKIQSCLKKQYEQAGTSYLRLLANSFRQCLCSNPPCNKSDAKLKIVIQDDIISATKGFCIQETCFKNSLQEAF